MGKELYYVWIIISQSNDYVSASEIVERLEDYNIHIGIKRVYSLVTILNDLTDCFCGKPLIIRTSGNGYRVEEGVLEDGQLQFLLDMIINNKNMDKTEQESFSEKLLSLSSVSQKSRLNLHDINDNGDKDMLLSLTTIIQAINRKNNIRFRYINYSIRGHELVEVESDHGNAGKDYIVSPYYLYYANGNHYLLCYYEKYPEKLTTFRLDRMRIVRSSRGHFDDFSEQYDLEKEIHNINMYTTTSTETLHIQFKKYILREVVDRFGTDIYVNSENDDWVDVTIENVGISEGLKGWLFMVNRNIRVITPLSLRDDMQKTIEEMLSMYK